MDAADCKRCARPPVPLAPGAECKESLDLVTGKLPEYPEFLRSSLVPSESNNLTKRISIAETSVGIGPDERDMLSPQPQHIHTENRKT